MTEATAENYAWVDETRSGMAVAYCLTLVRDRTPEQVLDGIGAVEVTRGTGLDAVVLGGPPARDGRMPTAVSAVGEWTLMYENNDFKGVTESVLARLSRGTTTVSHFKNVNGVDRFRWFEDGTERLTFQPLFPAERYGTDAEAMAGQMREVGFDLTDLLELDEETEDFGPATRGAFALAERISGVRVTPELLAGATFVGAHGR